MRTRHNGVASSLASRSSTDATATRQECNCISEMKTTIDPRLDNPVNFTYASHNAVQSDASLSSTRTSTALINTRKRSSLGSPLALFLLVICLPSATALPVAYARMSSNDAAPVRRTRDLQLPVVFNVNETVLPGLKVAAVQAEYSAGSTGARNFTFRINRWSDPQRLFSVDQAGQISVARPLDREKQAVHNLVVEVFDSSGQSGNAYIKVILEDVNDNAPDFVPNVIVCTENDPKSQESVVAIQDADTDEFGPPFNIQPVPGNSDLVKYTFDAQTNKVTFRCEPNLDREGKQGKDIVLKFSMSDSGQPQQTAIRTMTVVIGDRNDNPAFDGNKEIRVVAYEKGQLPDRMPIGRVYVQDLDDWDNGDKIFEEIEDTRDIFTIDRVGGMIYMQGTQAAPGNSYTVKAAVRDQTRPNDKQAIGVVTVQIEKLTEKAFENAGTIRLKGVTAAEFIARGPNNDQRSMLDKFKTKLAALLGIGKEEYIDVFSVMDKTRLLNGGDPIEVTDVWFSVLDGVNEYKQATYLNGMVQRNREDFEADLKANIIMVNIDECYFPQCDECYTRKEIFSTPVLRDSNSTALVSANTNTTGECGACQKPQVPTGCTANTCYNGGVCHPVKSGFFCECRGENFGPRCEGTMRSFKGSGFAWVTPPTKTCTSTNVTFSFATSKAPSMLIYFGPMYEAREGDIYAPDLLAITLDQDGKLELRINVGIPGCNDDGTCTSTARVNTATSLADGKWHTVDFHFRSREYTLTIDKCRDLATGAEQSSCFIRGIMAGDDERFNIVDPIQIGGIVESGNAFRYPENLSTYPRFNGCMREVYWNNELLDMRSTALSADSEARCVHTDSICATNDVSGPGYCKHGTCMANLNDAAAKCDCQPGWRGKQCDERVPWVRFNPSSFVQYALAAAPDHRSAAEVRALVVPQKVNDGTMSRADSQDRSRYMSMMVRNSRLTGQYDVGFGQQHRLEVTNTTLSTTEPIWVSFEVSPLGAHLSVDDKPGDFSAYVLNEKMTAVNPVSLDLAKDAIFLGAESERMASDFVGCVGDYRFNDIQMPLDQKDQTNIVSIKNAMGVKVEDHCADVIQTCASGKVQCVQPLVCLDLWKGAFCTCPEGTIPNLDENGRVEGCNSVLAQRKLGITNWAIMAIIICLMLLLMIILLMVVYTRRRKPFVELRDGTENMDNQMNYAIEGGGETDQDTYNIGPLRKPVLGDGPPPVAHKSDTAAKVAAGVRAANNDGTAAPYDELRVYGDEGDTQSIATLSSISSAATTVPDLDDKLKQWGPKFNKLSNMYNQE